MNENFLAQLNISNLSLYKISQETGISYSNLSRLKTGKQNINKCEAKDVCKLALFFNCKIEELLNPINYLEGIHGVYEKVHYKWEKDLDNEDQSKMVLKVKEENGYKNVISLKIPLGADRYKNRIMMTEGILNGYLYEKRCKEEMNLLAEERIYERI